MKKNTLFRIKELFGNTLYSTTEYSDIVDLLAETFTKIDTTSSEIDDIVSIVAKRNGLNTDELFNSVVYNMRIKEE